MNTFGKCICDCGKLVKIIAVLTWKIRGDKSPKSYVDFSIDPNLSLESILKMKEMCSSFNYISLPQNIQCNFGSHYPHVLRPEEKKLYSDPNHYEERKRKGYIIYKKWEGFIP